MRRGPLTAGEKVQFTDRRSNKITDQLVPGGVTQTSHGIILHDDVIGQSEGSVVVTVSAKREAQINQDHPERDANKPWKGTRAIGGWQFAVMRPRLADYVLSMPRGAQIMYPKDIAQVIQLGDIRSGMNVLESGAGSGAMSVNLLDAVGERGRLTTIEMRSEFARVAEANATVYFGGRPAWWDLKIGDFDSVAATLPEHSFDRIMLDMLDPWNRLEQAYRVIARRCARGVCDHYYAAKPYGGGVEGGWLLDGTGYPGDSGTRLEGSGIGDTSRPSDDRTHRLPYGFAGYGAGISGVAQA